MEIKLTIGLDDKTHETLNALIAALNGKIAVAVDADSKPAEAPKKKPIKATAAPIEETPVLEPQDEPKQEESEPAADITIEDLRALLANAKREKGTDAIKAILKSYGVTLLSDLDSKHYGAVAKKVRAL